MWFFLYFFLHLVIYTLIRLEFLIWNWGYLQNLSYLDLGRAFLNGIRFDLSVLSYVLGLAFLGYIWLSKSQKVSRIWMGFYIFLNAIFLVFNVIDVELFNFTAKRFTITSFFLAQDAHVSNIIIPYIPLAICSAVLVFGYIYLAYLLLLRLRLQLSLSRKIILTLLVLIVSVIASRGGLQHKPLTYVDAKIFQNSYANNLVLNTTFTLAKSATQKSLNRQQYFSNEQMLTYLNPQAPLDFEVPVAQPPLNVVILILESFSSEYLQIKNPEVTPYLNRLAAKSIQFKTTYANGRRSIEGIAAIMSGIPALMEVPFINSEFSANQVIGVGSLLSERGYNTSFFHGTNKGSMHFDAFMKSVGVESHYAQEDYPKPSDHDGTWGIFDEPFLLWTCDQISHFQNPFLTSIFTLTSHQPYRIPEAYRNQFTDSRHDILRSIQYADWSLEKFMNCAEQKPWFKNTVFILTADHTGPPLKSESSFISRYEVPLIIYAPYVSWLRQLNTEQVAQHIDILPTILDILKIPQKKMNYLSRSLLRSGPKLVTLYSDGQYELVGDVTDPEKQLKAVQQYFSQGLYDNRLYYPSKRE